MELPIPDEVLKAIEEHAEDLGDTADERRQIVATETDFYRKYRVLDRSALGSAAEEVEEVFTYWSSWEERFQKLADEIAAASDIRDAGNFGLPEGVFSFVAQRLLGGDELPTTKLDKMRSFCETYSRITPIKRLLIDAEKIIGNECYNGYMQNYGPYGQFEGEGRKYRFPVSFPSGDRLRKTRASLPEDIDPEALARACYVFGANDLFIMGGLLKVLDMIERDLSPDFPPVRGRVLG